MLKLKAKKDADSSNEGNTQYPCLALSLDAKGLLVTGRVANSLVGPHLGQIFAQPLTRGDCAADSALIVKDNDISNGEDWDNELFIGRDLLSYHIDRNQPLTVAH